MGCYFLPFAKEGPLVSYAPGYAPARLVGYSVGVSLGSAPMISHWALEAKPFSLAFSVCASAAYARRVL